MITSFAFICAHRLAGACQGLGEEVELFEALGGDCHLLDPFRETRRTNQQFPTTCVVAPLLTAVAEAPGQLPHLQVKLPLKLSVLPHSGAATTEHPQTEVSSRPQQNSQGDDRTANITWRSTPPGCQYVHGDIQGLHHHA